MSVIAWIVIGLLAGWLATRIMGGRGGLMRNLLRVSDRDRHRPTSPDNLLAENLAKSDIRPYLS
jgi:hypothetical protein